MAENLRSRIITQGVQRSPNRSMLRAVGFGDNDFEKAIIGVANGYSTITPCNLGLNILANRAETAVKAAGAMPQMFGTITVSDGISMGTEGMKYSLVSREVIADSIETACNAAEHGRSGRRRRMRQEHARRDDRDRAHEYPCDFRLWWHYQTWSSATAAT